MKKTMIVVSALVVLLCFHGCSQSEMSEVNTKTVDPVETVDSAEEKARQIAIQKFDEESKLELNIRQEYEITTVREEPDEWVIHFERKVQTSGGKVGVPDGHALVTVNKTTGEATYAQGQ
jgi:predicted transcriptional regulator